MRSALLLLALAFTWLTNVTAAPHIIFLVGDGEYHTAETIPAWAKSEIIPQGIQCTFLIDDGKSEPDFPALAELPKADALFISLKRRALPPVQLNHIRKFIESGKPVLGIRTASHAFAPKKPTPDRVGWEAFDRDVFGATYEGHYDKGPATLARIEAKIAKHPILTGWPSGEQRFASHLYKSRALTPDTTVLLTGTVDGKPDNQEPLTWINVTDQRKAFYTSLGSPADFEQPAFRRLLVNAVLWAVDAPIPAP